MMTARQFPCFIDGDGNQTTLLTSTGEWMVSYNVLNQATAFAQGSKRIECVYDYLNRRMEKTVYDGDSLVSRKRFIYLGYLQVAELDASNGTETDAPILRKTYLWDPMESVATHILVMSVFDEAGVYQEDLYYTHDLLKNTTALFGIQGGRRALYEYGPYGDIIKMEGNAAEINSFRFSSEYLDDDLGLVYYNYRYYNVLDGRWINRDPMAENAGFNLYCFVNNTFLIDWLGLDIIPTKKECLEKAEKEIKRQIEKQCREACEAALKEGSTHEACQKATAQMAELLLEATKRCAGFPKKSKIPKPKNDGEDNTDKPASIMAEIAATYGGKDGAVKAEGKGSIDQYGNSSTGATVRPSRHGETGVEGNMKIEIPISRGTGYGFIGGGWETGSGGFFNGGVGWRKEF